MNGQRSRLNIAALSKVFISIAKKTLYALTDQGKKRVITNTGTIAEANTTNL